MWPTLFEVDGPSGHVALHSYGLLVLLGFVGASLLVTWRARRMGMPLERLPIAFLVAALGGFSGAKVLYAIGVGDPGALLTLSGGYAWYGGVLGGAAAVVAATRPLGIDAWKLADATAPALVLGGGIGRVGCFFAGCCHGVPVLRPEPATALLPEGALGGQIYAHPHFPFLSTAFHGGVARFQDVPLYPTQVWQAVGSFLLVAVLLAVSQRRRFDGQIAGLYMVTEPWLRIAVETFRGDHRGYALSVPVDRVPAWLPGMGSAGDATGQAVVGLTTSQAIGLAMVVVGAILLWVRRNKGVAPEVPVQADWADDLIDGL